MKRFGFWLDPLFLLAATVYALNQAILKPWLSYPFLHEHLNDLLLVPAALPIVLGIQHLWGLRPGDHPPSGGEIVFHAAVWSIICEGIGPFLLHHGTADPWDVIAYAAGGLLSWVCWNEPGLKLRRTTHEF